MSDGRPRVDSTPFGGRTTSTGTASATAARRAASQTPSRSNGYTPLYEEKGTPFQNVQTYEEEKVKEPFNLQNYIMSEATRKENTLLYNTVDEEEQGQRFEAFIRDPFVMSRITGSVSPDEEFAKAANVFALADELNLSIETVHKNYNAIADNYFGKGGTELTRKEKRDTFLKIGRMGYDEGLLLYEDMHDRTSDADKKKLEEYSVLTPQYKVDYKDIPEVFKHALYTNLPMMLSSGLEGMEKSLAIGGAFAAVGAIGGSSVPVVGTATGAGASFTAGFAVAKTYFTTDAIRRTTAGQTYKHLMSLEGENGEKIPKNVARDVAEISGGLSALTEVAGLALLLTGIPGISKVVDMAIKHGPTLLGKTMVGQMGAKFFGHLIGAEISENIEEFAQGGIEAAAESVAIALTGYPEAFDGVKTTRKELFDEIKTTALSTSLLAPFMGLAPAAFQAGLKQSQLVEDVNLAARDAVKQSLDPETSVKEAMQILKEDPRVQVLSNRKLLTILATTEERANYYKALSKNAENIDVNLTELYREEVDKKYSEYLSAEEEKGNKTPQSLSEFENAYLATQGRSVPVSEFSDSQISWMYSRLQAEHKEAVEAGMDPAPLPTMADYKKQFADAKELYNVLNRKSRTAETLTRMQEAKDSLQQMSEEAPGEIPGVIQDALQTMQKNIDSARQAASGLVAENQGDAVIYKGPEAYTTKDIELINNKKIEALQAQIKELEEAKKSSEVSTLMEVQANVKMLEIEERILQLEREKKDIDYFLRNQYYNQRKATEYIEKARERSGRINELLQKKNDPEFIRDLSNAGADAVYDEIEELKQQDIGNPNARDVPHDIVALLGLNETDLSEAIKTRNAFRLVWQRAFEMANAEKKLDMSIGQQMKAYQSAQTRRVDSLLAQINKPMGAIHPRRQEQIRTARALIGLQTSENINYASITQQIKEIMDSETTRLANEGSSYFVETMRRVVANAEDLKTLENEKDSGQLKAEAAIFKDPEKLESNKRKFHWNFYIYDAVKTVANESEVSSGVVAAKETLAALDEINLEGIEDDAVWSNVIDATVEIAESAIARATVSDYTKQAFQDQIEYIMKAYEVGDGKKKTMRSIEVLESTKALIDFLRYAGKVELEANRTFIDTQSALGSSLIENHIEYEEGTMKGGVDPNEASKLKKEKHGAAGTVKHPASFFREIGGKALQEMFVTEPRYTKNEETKQIKRRSEAVYSLMKELKIKLKDLQKTEEMGGRLFTLQERMGIYLAVKDKRTFNSLVETNVITREVGNNIEEFLTDKEMRLAEFLGGDFKEAWERMSPVFMATKQRALGRLMNYLPIIRKYIDTTDMETSLLDNMLFGDKTYDSSIYDKFGEARQLEGLSDKEKAEKINKAQEIRIDLFDMWSDTVHKQEHYIAAAERAKIMENALSGASQRLIEKRYGSKVYGQAMKYVKDYANPARIQGSTWFDKAARTLRGNVTYGHLAAAPSIIWRQGLSGPLYMMYVSPDEYFAAMGNFWKNPKKAMDWMKENMPYIIQSGVGFDLINTRVENASGIRAVKRKIQDIGMGGITIADQITKAIGARAVYNQDVGLYGHEQAIKNAIKVTDITQPTSDRTALPDIYRQGAVVDWLMMYQQQPLKILNLMTYEMKQKAMDMKHDPNALGNMIYGSIAIMISMSGIWILKNRRLPETPEDIAEIMLLGVAGEIPMMGRYLVNGATRKYSGDSAAFDWALAIGKLASDAPAKDKLSAVFFDLGTAFTGVNPGNAVQNVLDFIDTGAPGEILWGGQWGE